MKSFLLILFVSYCYGEFNISELEVWENNVLNAIVNYESNLNEPLNDADVTLTCILQFTGLTLASITPIPPKDYVCKKNDPCVTVVGSFGKVEATFAGCASMITDFDASIDIPWKDSCQAFTYSKNIPITVNVELFSCIKDRCNAIQKNEVCKAVPITVTDAPVVTTTKAASTTYLSFFTVISSIISFVFMPNHYIV